MGNSSSQLSKEELRALRKATECEPPQQILRVLCHQLTVSQSIRMRLCNGRFLSCGIRLPSLTKLYRSYKAFRKECPSGKLDRPGFIEIYREIFPFGNPEEFANYVFRVYDQNEDNEIDFRELICGLSVTSRGKPEDKVKCAPRSYTVISLTAY